MKCEDCPYNYTCGTYTKWEHNAFHKKCSMEKEDNV